MRRTIRVVVFGFVVGALLTGSGLAGVVVDPLGIGSSSTPSPTDAVTDAVDGPDLESSEGPAAASSTGTDQELSPEEIPAVVSAELTAPTDEGPLPNGHLYAGAARASLSPAPEVFGDPDAGDEWQTEGCSVIDPLDGNVSPNGDHVVPSLEDMRGWPAASPNCVYLGGFGIGPVRPAERVGQGGVWVRAIALSNGADTFVYAIADTVGWFARYDTKLCPTDDCGILDVRERVASDVGIDVGNVIVGSTHTHAGADTYGGWGGIPEWYRAQIRDAAIAAAKQAVANLEPAKVDIGEAHLRDRNNERRDTYYSTADTGATWLQARGGGDNVIATWLTYAGHPTIVSDPILHADWPGAAARSFEAEYGGVGLVFEGGLGNVSVSGAGSGSDAARAEATGAAIAADVSEAIDSPHRRTRLESNEMVADTQVITHPVATNPGLTTLALAGLFDREFTPGTPGAGLPGAYHWSKKGEASTDRSHEETDPEFDPVFLNGCSSSGPTIITAAGAHRIGEFTVAFGPGEIFSNIAEVVKERADRSAVTMVLGQTNDALGYIIQSFEYDTAANVATEYATQTNEYEEVFAVDRCFGDHVVEAILESTSTVGTGR